MTWDAWWFLACSPVSSPIKGEHPKGAAVSVTAANLKDNLWPELSKWQQKSPFLSEKFEWTKERIYAVDHPETWFLSARSWGKDSDEQAQGRTLSGLHSQYVLCLIDESGEIPLSVLKAGEQALSNCTWGKIIQAGNPSSMNGMLYAAASTLRSQWEIIRITGDPDDPERSPRIDIEWAREQIKNYGRDNPWVMYSILGEFPPSSINSLLGIEDVQTAMNRHYSIEKYDYSQKRLGVDVALSGDDRTVIYPRQGLIAFKPVVMRNAKPSQIAARIIQAIDRWGQTGTKDIAVFIDNSGGFGSGVIDSLSQAGQSAIAVNFAGKAIDPRYFNTRSEIWINYRDWVLRGGALPNSQSLVRESTEPTYSLQGGKFRLEEKAQIKKRLGFSPDEVDALALTFTLPDRPANDYGGVTIINPMNSYSNTRGLADYDPFTHNRS